MLAHEVVLELQAGGYSIAAAEGRLEVRGPGPPSPELEAAIREHREQLLKMARDAVREEPVSWDLQSGEVATIAELATRREERRGGTTKTTTPPVPEDFTRLTVAEAATEINRPGSGAYINTQLYRRGEIAEGDAIQWITCAILHRRRESFEDWRRRAPAVRKALGRCSHEVEPKACKLCNGVVRSLIPVSPDLEAGESATVAELRARHAAGVQFSEFTVEEKRALFQANVAKGREQQQRKEGTA
jgi:hypothetical protein